MKRSLLRTVLCSVILTSAASFSVRAVSYGGHNYSLTSAGSSWTAAEAEAVGAGGHLVAINDAAEQAFLQTFFASSDPTPHYYWIGLTDAAVEGNWVWSNGEPTTYLNWAAFEPKVAPDPARFLENWAIMNFEGNSRHGRWHDVDNDRSFRGIIETVPESGISATLLAGVWTACALLVRRTR